jgi:hypothetical protein
MASNDRMTDEMDRIWKEAVMVIRDITPAFAWRDYRNPQRASVMMARVEDEIRMQHLLIQT